MSAMSFELLDLSRWLNYVARQCASSQLWGSGMLDYALDYSSKQADTNALVMWLPVVLPISALVFVLLCRSLLLKNVAPPGLGVRRLWIAFSAAYAVWLKFSSLSNYPPRE
eukprot:4572208-Pyramimonas_sp.AAC.1